MPYFSRLTDIVTCSLSEILEESQDPQTTLKEVSDEMSEGLSSARRVARTSAANRDGLEKEIASHVAQQQDWLAKATTALAAGDETAAREALTRKVEVEDLIDGLKPEREAAASNYNHMLRIQKALEARFAEAQRLAAEMSGDQSGGEVRLESETAVHAINQSQQEKSDEVEAELAALKKQLGG